MAKKKKKSEDEILGQDEDFLLDEGLTLEEEKLEVEDVLGELDLNKIPGKFRKLIGRI